MRIRSVLLCLAGCITLVTPPSVKAEAVRDVSALLRGPRTQHGVPGMVGAIVHRGRVVATGANGVRNLGVTTPIQVTDRVHLGSCTKAMTATLAALMVEDGTVAWDTTVGDVFSDAIPNMEDGWRGVTLERLLRHRGGAPADLLEGGLWHRVVNSDAAPVAQRRLLVETLVTRAPAKEPSAYLYSNAGYAIAGAMLEARASEPWEQLLRRRLFVPLGMESAGYGAPGRADVLDEPRGHTVEGKPMTPGRTADNPPAIGPGGTVHASILDWARFVALHLEGRHGELQLRKDLLRELHRPPKGGEYAMGWIVVHRDWGGRVLTHAGSNTYWHAVTWISPSRDFATLVVANRGGPDAEKATDTASWALIQDHLANR